MVNAASGQVSIQYGLRGPNYAVATACASAANAIGDAFRAIQYDDADVMITGGTEAAITPMGISGFANMRALSGTQRRPAKCQPAVRSRSRRLCAERRGRAVGARRTGARQSPRRTHLCRSVGLRRQRPMAATSPSPTRTAPAPPGPCKPAFATARSTRVTIGYINAHGTSTPLGDAGRDRGHQVDLRRTCPQAEHLQHQEPTGPFAGGQRRRGTGLSDAGLRDSVIPPTINLENPDPKCDLDYTPNRRPRAEIEGGHVQQLWLRRAQRLADRGPAAGLAAADLQPRRGRAS